MCDIFRSRESSLTHTDFHLFLGLLYKSFSHSTVTKQSNVLRSLVEFHKELLIRFYSLYKCITILKCTVHMPDIVETINKLGRNVRVFFFDKTFMIMQKMQLQEHAFLRLVS